MLKLVFSRCLGKPSTATRHLGPKTGTVFSVRENPSKSPKRPALPGAVNWEGAVSRHRPFLLLLFHTLSAALIRAFFHWPDFGPLWAFLGLGRVLLYPGRKLRTQGHTGANRGARSGLLPGAKKPLPGFAWQRPFALYFMFSK